MYNSLRHNLFAHVYSASVASLLCQRKTKCVGGSIVSRDVRFNVNLNAHKIESRTKRCLSIVKQWRFQHEIPCLIATNLQNHILIYKIK